MALLLIEGCSLARTVATPSKLLSYWVEMGPGSQVIARAVVAGATCPHLSVDALYTVKMVLRSEPVAKGAFPVGICEAELPPDAKVITLDDNLLPPAPTKNPNRILVVGDTGCRIKVSKEENFIQDCSKPEGWPFPRIMKAAAKWNPDLVIHVGDYHYRESDCPAGLVGDAKCRDSVAGDRWESWKQDFFKPAEPLLEKAPWIFVRGNHENCARAGVGWFKLLDPRPYLAGAPCNDHSLPYVVGSNPPIAVVDASTASNIGPSLDRLSEEDSTPSGIWLALHRPFMGPLLDPAKSGDLPKLSEDMQDPGRLSLILAGHLHRLSLNNFLPKDHRPLEIITGNAGANLDPVTEIKKTVGVFKGKDFRSNIYKGFGFLTFERVEDQIWTLTAHDENGDPMITCKVHEAQHKKTLLLCDE